MPRALKTSPPARGKPKATKARKALVAAEPAPPRYTPTPDEEALVARVNAANKPIKVVGETNASGGVVITPQHPDPAVGGCQLMEAFGVTDSTMLDGLLLQLTQIATTSKGDEIDFAKLNSLIAYVRGIGPRDAIEAMHAVQMAAVHSAMMNTSRLFKNNSQASSSLEAFESASNSMNKLARSWSMQVETLKKHRSTGEQSIRVQHVTVADGGQAIVGNGPMTVGGRGAASKKEHQPHEPRADEIIVDEAGTPLLSYVEAIGPALPGSGEARLERVPLSRSQGRSA